MPLTLLLEPTDDLADPLFRDALSCAEWLKKLQLTNLHLAHSLLLTQINELNRFPMRGLERLNTLEVLRDTVHYVQNDYAKKIISKPLPLHESELITFLSMVQLWQAMTHGYQRCLQAYIALDKQLAKHGALLCQRSLMYSGLAISEHLRTGYEFDARLWRQLHEQYAFAEEHGLQFKDIADPLPGKAPSGSCHDIYVKILLFCYVRAAELTRSQLLLLDTWLTEWKGTVQLERGFAISKRDAQPLAVDLGSSQGLQPVKFVTHNDSMHYLAMVPLSKLLRVKTILLQQGQTPRQLKLGDHHSGAECTELLTFLHQCWCEDSNTRFGERQPGSQHAQLCSTSENIYRCLTETIPKQATANITQPDSGFPLETWSLDNQSILGARLSRVDASGGRLNHNQLIALRIRDEEDFTLGVTTWVSVARTGQLSIGVRYLPGTAQPVRLNNPDASPDAHAISTPGFLLQAVPALKSPASLIVPSNWFKADLVLELQHRDGEKLNAKLGFSVERGIDYERVSFTLV